MDWLARIDRSHPTPIYRQVVEAVRSGIEAGRLEPGARLPSATDIARLTGIGRPTAVRALRELESAGLTTSHVGRGSFVAAAPSASGAGERPPMHGGSPALATPDLQRIMRQLRANHMKSIARLASVQPPGDIVDFRPGYPPDACVPTGFAEIAHGVVARDDVRLSRYTPRGLPELIEQLARWLTDRGYDVTPDEIMITNGSQDALSFLGMWAAREGRQVLCETPTWWGIIHAFAFCGHEIESVPWVEDRMSLRPHPGRAPSLLYVGPDFNNPTGRCLSAAGRRAIADVADREDMFVVVDDIFRDLRFDGDELPSLYTYLPPSRRLLVGSFSKSFMPGLRVGFLVADASLIEEFWSTKQYLDLGGPPLMQALAAAFLENGLTEHLDAARAYYRERQRATCDALERHMPDGVRFTRPEGGFHLWVELPEGVSSVPVYLEGLEHGVAIVPGPMHDIDGGYRNCFRISYGHATPERIDRAIATLGEITKSVLQRGPEPASASGLPSPL